MSEENYSSELDVLKEAISDDNISIQVDAIKRLPALAAALGVERTRGELIPCISDSLTMMCEELLYNLAEQLEKFVPLVGGNEYANCVLDILIKLSYVDETIVRERAVGAMKTICDGMDNEHCERCFFPLIENLISADWFTSKCSATSLFAMCYPKMSSDKQAELRNIFRNLIQDDSPMVRRFAENGLVDFIPLLDIEQIKSDFAPIFDNLSVDDQDSVRVLAVDVGIAIAKRLKDFEIYEYLLNTFRTLCADISWRVRQRVALRIHDIQSISTFEKGRQEVLIMYDNLVKDLQSEVRVIAASNLYNFTESLYEGYKKTPEFADVFEKDFVENLMPLVHYLIIDVSEDVRLALSINILSLSGVLRKECFNDNILPLITDALENEESIPFKENMLKNLNSLPIDIDITKSFKSISRVIKNLLFHSQMHWRTRRNLLLAFMHIIHNSTTEFFEQNLKIFYLQLLYDSVYAIRRTTPLILPLLIKQFGMKWAKDSLIPIFTVFAKDQRYLYRYVTLFGIDELIEPTLNKENGVEGKNKYLHDFKELSSNKSVTETLVKISKLNEMLSNELDNFKFEDDEIYLDDNIKMYAEDTLDSLKNNHRRDIFQVTLEDFAENSICYLQGVMLVLVKEFVKCLKLLLADPIHNVRLRTKSTIKKMGRFSTQLRNELEQSWVQEAIEGLSDEDLVKIGEELTESIKINSDEESLNTELLNEMDLDDVETLPDLGIEVDELEVNNNSSPEEDVPPKVKVEEMEVRQEEEKPKNLEAKENEESEPIDV